MFLQLFLIDFNINLKFYFADNKHYNKNYILKCEKCLIKEIQGVFYDTVFYKYM